MSTCWPTGRMHLRDFDDKGPSAAASDAEKICDPDPRQLGWNDLDHPPATFSLRTTCENSCPNPTKVTI